MIKGCKNIAEYAIRRWLEKENFVMSCFKLKLDGNVAIVTDRNGDELKLIYDGNTRCVSVDEGGGDNG